MSRVPDLSQLRSRTAPPRSRSVRLHVPTFTARLWTEILAAVEPDYRARFFPVEVLVQMHIMDSALRRGVVPASLASRVRPDIEEGGGL